MKSIRNAYKDASNKERKVTGNSMVVHYQRKREGHILLLGESMDKRLQLYLKAIRANGGPATAGMTIAAARG